LFISILFINFTGEIMVRDLSFYGLTEQPWIGGVFSLISSAIT